jgi:2-dehydro-3-deoxygluconokinase
LTQQAAVEEGAMDTKRFQVATFGEIMMRLSPPNHLRLPQTDRLDMTFGGGESNVAVSLLQFGVDCDFITRLPDNDLGHACLQYLRRFGVGTEHILRGGERMGIYFLEHGAAQRGGKVIYDRSHSAFAEIQPGMVDWRTVLAHASWFHWTGITPATAPGPAQVCLEGVQEAKAMGLMVSCDLNYRSKLWNWGRPAEEVMAELVALSDLAVGNEEDADKVFGIRAPDTDVTRGKVDAEKYFPVCEALALRFPGLHTIAITLRGSISASHNSWSGLLWSRGKVYRGAEYEISPIVDRVGAGDSFVAGLIYAWHTYSGDNQRAIDFAVAASALKHTIFGDFNLVSVSEVEQLMRGDRSGRVRR